jgi:hypothetical protein
VSGAAHRTGLGLVDFVLVAGAVSLGVCCVGGEGWQMMECFWLEGGGVPAVQGRTRLCAYIPESLPVGRFCCSGPFPTSRNDH